MKPWAGRAGGGVDERLSAINSSIGFDRRMDRQGRDLLILLNFQPLRREEFCLRVPTAGVYEEVLNTDEERFGGGGDVNREPLRTREVNGSPTLSLNLPAMGATILRCARRNPTKKKKP